MIPRYKVKEISDIWSTKNKLDTWLKVELAHLSSLTGNIINRTITEEELQTIKDNVKIDVDRWKEIEKETKHDLQAFVQMLEESVPGDAGRWGAQYLDQRCRCCSGKANGGPPELGPHFQCEFQACFFKVYEPASQFYLW